MHGHKQQVQQPQPYSYIDSGYNPFMERSPRTYNANDTINGQSSPFIESVVDNAIIYDPFADLASQNLSPATQQVSGDAVQGGTIKSSNGNLQIDLSNGTLNYNDGVTNLLSIGGNSADGTPNSLTAENISGQTILSSQPTGK